MAFSLKAVCRVIRDPLSPAQELQRQQEAHAPKPHHQGVKAVESHAARARQQLPQGQSGSPGAQSHQFICFLATCPEQGDSRASSTAGSAARLQGTQPQPCLRKHSRPGKPAQGMGDFSDIHPLRSAALSARRADKPCVRELALSGLCPREGSCHGNTHIKWCPDGSRDEPGSSPSNPSGFACHPS